MMRTFSMAEVTPVLEGMLLGESAFFSGVSIDTRTLNRGDLFVAIRGERFDGHDFVGEAARLGAVGLVVSRQVETDLPVIRVPDTTQALGRMAHLNRQGFTGPLIAVTGSNGKTTVKELMTAALGGGESVLSTRGNLNNAIGAPLTLLRLGPAHRSAVIELGASGVGEIAWTASLARPDVAVITNAGEAHIGRFGSYDNIVLAKGEIIDAVPPEGTVVLNADDPAFEKWRERAGSRPLVRVSAAGQVDADLWAEDIAASATGLRFTLAHRDGWRQELTLNLHGAHNVSNALLAFAASLAADRAPDEIAVGLATVKPVPGRMERIELAPGAVLYDDSYNANPTATAAALRTLAQCEGRRIAVLGDMAELGDEPGRDHRKIGELARQLGIDGLFCTGAHAGDYQAGFGDLAVVADGHDALVEALLPQFQERPVTLLVKGSRGAAMDRVVGSLKQRITD